jgi:probable dihydroxyacetone kinase regulator
MEIKLNTKRIIADAFEDLLKNQSFDSLTVQDIIKRCRISRTSFYRHFKDKYDLMNWIFKDKIEKIIRNNPNAFSPEDMSLQVLLFVKEKKTYFERSISYFGQNSLFSFICECGFKNCANYLKTILNVQTLPEDILFSVKLWCYGTTHILQEWINEGMSTPAELLAQRMNNNIPPPIAKCLKQHQEPIPEIYEEARKPLVSV